MAARTAIDIALSLAPPDAMTWYHAAAISAAEGDTERAITEVAEALASNPGFDPLPAIAAQELADDLATTP